jgi:alkanesulfonate monooxygenase SsuD/methylene tetrahydromethanopterin reductase-like flavin-dependent oxidoreductase (luciferase family)
VRAKPDGSAEQGALDVGRQGDAPDERPPVGLLLGSALPPENAPPIARLAESLGFRELWYSEHYFRSGGLTGAAVTLAATDRIPVGLGAVSVFARQPAVLAMEIATLARLYPGRLRAGIGLGEIERIREMGVETRARLEDVTACAASLRRILDGGEIAATGAPAGGPIRLAYPPSERVPIYLAAVRPRMLQFAGRFADGVLLTWIKGAAYVAWARAEVEAGAAEAGRADLPRIVSFVLFAVDTDRRRARREVREALLSELARGPSAVTDAGGFSSELDALLAEHGSAGLERQAPERWLEGLAIAGEPDECAAAITSHLEAGADAVVLCLANPDQAKEIIQLTACDVLPSIRSPRRSEES